MRRCAAALHAAPLLLLLLLLLLSPPGDVHGRNEPAKENLSASLDETVPRLTNATLQQHLNAVATSGRQLVFTTTSAWTPAITDMLKHFMWHLHHVRRDKNLMIISQDAGTCQKLVVRHCPPPPPPLPQDRLCMTLSCQAGPV